MAHAAETGMNQDLSDSGFSVAKIIDQLREAAQAQGRWKIIAVAKGEALLEQGDQCSDIFVLEAGLVKLSYLTEAGNEWIKSIIVDQGIFGGHAPSNSDEPNRFSAHCLENCVLVRLPSPWVRAAIEGDAGLAAAYLGFSEWVGARKARREELLLCQSPEQRYRTLLAEEPALVERLPQGDIARYLRVTPIAFSRIKKRVL